MAAVASDRDWLRGLKENVIIGRLIPARLDSLLQAENDFALREAMGEFVHELAPAWLSGDGEIPDEFAGLEGAEELIDENLVSGQALSQFGGTTIGDAGFQIRTAEEEDELLRRAQSLTDNDSEIDREVELTASRIFSPFEEEVEDIPRL
jgi:hypothetical protein